MVFQHSFLLNALLVGILASIACGIMGSFIVAKRMSFISGSIAHTVLGGLGVANYFGFHPLHGSIVAAIFAAVLIGIITMKSSEHEDTIIGALWAIGMAVGVIFTSLTPGYNVDLMSYLFGNILMVSKPDLWMILSLDIIILFTIMLFYNKIIALCFDEEFTKLQGIRVEAYYLVFLCLVALTVVILVYVVGLILVIALLTIPASIAANYTGSMLKTMFLAMLLGAFFTFAGLFISYKPGLPTGATIIIVAGISYMLSLGLKKVITGDQ